MSTTDTRETIMAVAKAMVQARGYNALSFREIAKDIGIKSASIHYHFPTKAELGAALAKRYTEDALEGLEQLLAADLDLPAKFDRYVSVFRAALLNDNRMCLYGIMAAEYGDLPPEVRTQVDAFSAANADWLSRLLESDEARALAIFAAIEGAQLVARGRGDIAVFDQTIAAYRAAGLAP
ncbi:MAG: TetR/AcrR family transcriptional regulator [Caulobacter sp.]|nr:TetR/AcrR family transcriptional regulator [Caulobacter sp.]